MAWDKGSNLGSCCQDCQDRYEACHDSCPTYLEARKAWQEKQTMIREYKEKDVFFYRYKLERITSGGKAKHTRLAKKGRI